ncbi:hypothetical protein Agub_g6667, partial [Astrephomene gubernaculifera]
PCPEAVNVVTLREPLGRMESALRFIMAFVRGWWKRRDPLVGGKQFDEVFCNTNISFWEALTPPIVDNYIVRSFLGEAGFHTPLGSLTPAHLASARRQLLQWDLVLDLGAGVAASDGMAATGLGWPAAWSRGEDHRLNSTRISEHFNFNYEGCRLSDADWQELARRQGLDVQLYRFGRVLNRLDALWLDMARALGLQPHLPPPLADGEQQQQGPLQGLLQTTAAAAVDGGAAAHAAAQAAAAPPPPRPANATRCGMLWRGSNGSVLARALGLTSAAAAPSLESSSPS